MRIGALTQEYNAQYTSAVNNTIEKDNAFSSILFDKNEQSVIEAGISSQEVEITDQDYGFNNEKPTFYWHDGKDCRCRYSRCLIMQYHRSLRKVISFAK